MLSIASKVEQIVTESPFLTEGMALGLINLSELARQLRPELETALWKPVGQAAVVMALRRLSDRLPELQAPKSPPIMVPRMSELTTRTELTLCTYKLSDNSHECQRQLLALADPYPGMFISVTRGVSEMMVVCSRPLTNLVEDSFGQSERLLARVENLTALTLRLNPDTRRTPGVYHAVLKKLAWEKVAVVNLMCTYTELTLLLDPCQTAGAFSVLSQIVSH